MARRRAATLAANARWGNRDIERELRAQIVGEQIGVEGPAPVPQQAYRWEPNTRFPIADTDGEVKECYIKRRRYIPGWGRGYEVTTAGETRTLLESELVKLHEQAAKIAKPEPQAPQAPQPLPRPPVGVLSTSAEAAEYPSAPGWLLVPGLLFPVLWPGARGRYLQ